MNTLLKIVIPVLLAVGQLNAQLRYTYDFSTGLEGIEPGAPPLKVLGEMGEIKDEPIRELKGNVKLAYHFSANSGLSFDNRLAKGFLDKSYSVEMYFKFQNLESWRRVIDFKNRKSDYGCYMLDGKVNFFNFAVGENAATRAGKYTHYVFTRDHKRDVIQIYVDGELKLEFPDKKKEAVISKDQVLNFFQDDLIVNHESSAGAVAYLRVYDEVVNPVFVRRRFRELAKHLRAGNTLAERQEDEEAGAEEAERADETQVDDIVLSGRIYNASDLQPISRAELHLKTMRDSTLMVSQVYSSDYSLKIRPQSSYKLGVFATGYKPREIIVGPAEVSGVLREHIRMEAEVFSKPITVISFDQGGDGIKQDAEGKIEEIVAFLRLRPDLGVRLEGHTDNVGDFDKNVRLSWERVEQVKKILLSHQISPERILSQGYGPVRPAGSNQTEATRRRNRRVEVWPVHLPR